MHHERVLSQGLIERLGQPNARATIEWTAADQTEHENEIEQDIPEHRSGLQLIFDQLKAHGLLQHLHELSAIGHRVVHGGEAFTAPARIDETVLAAIEKMIPLAPLHNPANLEGIKICRSLNPNIPQIAVFDTAFHQTMPPAAYHYALPSSLYKEHGIRRYGFHGTSHQYVAQLAANYLKRPLQSLNLITLHLGNGCSAAAIKAGQSIDTSMGMTPLEGLIMGTRSGDIDPEIIFFLARETGMALNDIEAMLNKKSGLKGISGVSDMREVQQKAKAGDPQANLALSMFAYRVKKYIGAYFAALGRVDAIVFTGGIGENSPEIRNLICTGLNALGIKPAHETTQQNTPEISTFHQSEKDVALLVIPTDEELSIARSCIAACHAEQS